MTSWSKGGGGQSFRDDSTKALVMKRVTMKGEGEGAKIVQNCVTSFVYDP